MNIKTASKKTLKYIIPASANMAVTQSGMKSTENKSKKKAKILWSIFSFYSPLSYFSR